MNGAIMSATKATAPAATAAIIAPEAAVDTPAMMDLPSELVKALTCDPVNILPSHLVRDI